MPIFSTGRRLLPTVTYGLFVTSGVFVPSFPSKRRRLRAPLRGHLLHKRAPFLRGVSRRGGCYALMGRRGVPRRDDPDDRRTSRSYYWRIFLLSSLMITLKLSCPRLMGNTFNEGSCTTCTPPTSRRFPTFAATPAGPHRRDGHVPRPATSSASVRWSESGLCQARAPPGDVQPPGVGERWSPRGGVEQKREKAAKLPSHREDRGGREPAPRGASCELRRLRKERSALEVRLSRAQSRCSNEEGLRRDSSPRGRRRPRGRERRGAPRRCANSSRQGRRGRLPSAWRSP